MAALCPLGACHGSTRVAVDLIERFPAAIEVRPAVSTFSIDDVTIGGRRERAIVAATSSRLVELVPIPRRGQLHVSLGVPDDVASSTRDGVLFRVLVATEGSPGPDVLFSRRLNPAANAADRGWQDVVINLLPFAGDTVQLFFNTNGDVKAAWAAPRIVSR